MSIESSLAHPFLRPGAGRLTAAEQRRKNLSRTISLVLASLLHILFFLFFVFAVHPFDMSTKPIFETILTMPAPGNNLPKLRIVNPELPSKAPPRILSAPITLPKTAPPVIRNHENAPSTAPADILGAVGRTLACSAGSWEHLTAAERARCGGQPWQARRLPNGSLVMVPPSQLPQIKEESPEAEARISGSEQIQRDLETGPPCPILQNTPCLHPAQGGASINILGGPN